MKWRYLSHMQRLSKANHSLTAMAQKEVCPRDEKADPPGTAVLPIDKHDFAEGLVSFRMFVFSSYTCNRRSHLWDYVESQEALCYFLRIVSPTGCLVLPLSGTPFLSFLLISTPFCSFLLLSSPFFSFLLLSSFLEGGNSTFFRV